MCVFNALAWSKDNADRLLSTFHYQGGRLTAMVEDYILQLPRDRTLVHLATICGNTSENPSLSIESLAIEARTACRDFLRGDWACVTKLGAAMLNNTFQTSNPEIYPLNDQNLKTIFDGLNVLIYVQGLGYSTTGWTLAMEMDRTQSQLDKVFRTSSHKKNPMHAMSKADDMQRQNPSNIITSGGNFQGDLAYHKASAKSQHGRRSPDDSTYQDFSAGRFDGIGGAGSGGGGSGGGSAKPPAEMKVKKARKSGKVKHSEDSDKPKAKRIPPPYILFSADKRSEAKAAHPEATFGELGRILGQMWASLDEQGRSYWVKKNEELARAEKEAERAAAAAASSASLAAASSSSHGYYSSNNLNNNNNIANNMSGISNGNNLL